MAAIAIISYYIHTPLNMYKWICYDKTNYVPCALHVKLFYRVEKNILINCLTCISNK